MEAYRARAILALTDISERISANCTQAASYVSARLIGAGDAYGTNDNYRRAVSAKVAINVPSR